MHTTGRARQRITAPAWGIVMLAALAASCGGSGQRGGAVAAGAVTPDPGAPGRAALDDARTQRTGTVRPGISVLLSDSVHLVRGRRVALLTNQTGIDEHGVSDIDLMNGAGARAAGVQLVALFSPEHGIRGTEDRENLASGIDERTGVPVHSLYTNGTQGPPDSTLRGVQVLVVDLQDIGTRTWTYVGAMVYAMRSAARNHLPIVVLDRPNPLGNLNASGPMLDPALANADDPSPARPGRAYALYPVPLRHSLTMGEMASYLHAELQLGADLHVVPAAGWRRAWWFDQTGLPWVRPSPNLPTLESAVLYPSLVALEGSNLSVGRGTADAFQRFGAPWLRADSVVALLNGRRLPGVRFERSDFTPRDPGDGKYAGRRVAGVRILLTEREAYHAGRTGASILWAVARTSSDSLVVRAATFDDRFGRPGMREALLRGDDPDAVVARDDAAVAAWLRQVAPFRIYR